MGGDKVVMQAAPEIHNVVFYCAQKKIFPIVKEGRCVMQFVMEKCLKRAYDFNPA